MKLWFWSNQRINANVWGQNIWLQFNQLCCIHDCACEARQALRPRGLPFWCPRGAQQDWMTINWMRYRMCRIWPQRKDWNRHCRPASPGTGGERAGGREEKRKERGSEWVRDGDTNNVKNESAGAKYKERDKFKMSYREGNYCMRAEKEIGAVVSLTYITLHCCLL